MPDGNFLPQACPIDLFSAPRDGRDDGDDVFHTATDTIIIDTTVTIVTLLQTT
ncbi:MAG: hypothetical protein GX096_05675 [Clostridiales bacterium]|nr:hypothetical protein [Clostridiales bacterium]